MKSKFYQNVLKHEADCSIKDVLVKYCKYKKDRYCLYANQHKKFYEFTERLYVEAKDILGVYHRSYDEFLELLKNHEDIKYTPRPFRHRYRYYFKSYYFCPSPNYRKRSKYQKNKANLKNNPKDRVKNDWRKHQKIRRDKSRREPHWNPRGCPKWVKRKANGSHRAWERSNIGRGDWETLMDSRKLDWFQDPWSWD